jgi:hypothetical protein
MKNRIKKLPQDKICPKSDSGHGYRISFTGKINDVISYTYICSKCGEFMTTDKPLFKEPERGYYDGKPLTKI